MVLSLEGTFSGLNGDLGWNAPCSFEGYLREVGAFMRIFKSVKLSVVVGVSALLLGCPEAHQFNVQSMSQGIPGMVELLPGDNRCQLEDDATQALVTLAVSAAPVALPSESGKIPLPPAGSPIEWQCQTRVPGECADCNPFAGGGCPFPKEKHCRVVQDNPALTLCSCEERPGDYGSDVQPVPAPIPAPVQGVSGLGSKPYYENLVP